MQSYTDDEDSDTTFEFDDLPEQSFHTSLSSPDGRIPTITTMPYPRKNGNGNGGGVFDTSRSPTAKSRHRKLAMVVKKPPRSSNNEENDIDESSVPTLEGELTDFLSAVSGSVEKPYNDDGTTSTTSRTTKSSVNSHSGRYNARSSHHHSHRNSRNQEDNGGDHHHHNHHYQNQQHQHQQQQHPNDQSMGSRITEEHSERERMTNHNDWDWSHHSNDWMNFDSSVGGANNSNSNNHLSMSASAHHRRPSNHNNNS
eukprot:CAMPEP_0197179192 /NCGR_PEP_ID=MMETSP1423-20130617/4230_1 /TAXON_ID=476441 /ORGANISM="Pseudo-nitzschia heimii, Strain UNC1101" /LENGTH=254 /DNA_ID=CAMNT_0042629073 /DNA_START=129 /DNA_END=890 /DNA_ORIENTATION=+